MPRKMRSGFCGRTEKLTFAGSPRGAEASALFFSLIETAKANDLEPYAYLRFLFERLPLATTRDDYLALLPTQDFQFSPA